MQLVELDVVLDEGVGEQAEHQQHEGLGRAVQHRAHAAHHHHQHLVACGKTELDGRQHNNVTEESQEKRSIKEESYQLEEADPDRWLLRLSLASVWNRGQSVFI